ncbi:MAG TPA: hypothetical protein VN213_07825, partial [Solirubrobacteraceae bacterium]|nr:hypothetical protein [Solirubrobacteraceae bacterium]
MAGVTTLDARDPLAVAAVRAIRRGDVDALGGLLDAHPGLATARVVERGGPAAGSRTFLHVATDWPGGFP